MRAAVLHHHLAVDVTSAIRDEIARKIGKLAVIADAPDLAKEVLRVIHISKLQSAYRLAFAGDGETLNWLTMDDDKEVVLLTEPDTDWWTRVRTVLFAPFVPEEQL